MNNAEPTGTKTIIDSKVKKNRPPFRMAKSKPGTVAGLMILFVTSALFMRGENWTGFFVAAGDPKPISLYTQWTTKLPAQSGPPVWIGTAEIDGSSGSEVIVATMNGFLHILEGSSGALKRTIAVPDHLLSRPAISDLDSDGLEEIIVATDTGMVIALTGSGATMWSHDAYSGKTGIYRISLADINKDSTGDFAVLTPGGGVIGLDGDGGKAAWRLDPSKSGNAAGFATVKADGGRLHDLIILYENGVAIQATMDNVGIKAKWSADLPVMSLASPAFNNSPTEDIVVIPTRSGGIHALDIYTGKALWVAVSHKSFHAGPKSTGKGLIIAASVDGSIWFIEAHSGAIRRTAQVGRAVMAGPVAGDMNMDRFIEVAIFDINGELHLFDAESGEPVANITLGAAGGFYASPTLTDIDSDGRPELLAAGDWPRHDRAANLSCSPDGAAMRLDEPYRSIHRCGYNQAFTRRFRPGVERFMAYGHPESLSGIYIKSVNPPRPGWYDNDIFGRGIIESRRCKAHDWKIGAPLCLYPDIVHGGLYGDPVFV